MMRAFIPAQITEGSWHLVMISLVFLALLARALW